MRLGKLLCAALAVLSLSTPAAMAAELRIGATMSSFDDNWLTYLREYLDTKARSEQVDIQFEDARNDVIRQLTQVQAFISQDLDAIIVNAVDTSATARMTQAAVEAGIPLIYINRRPDEENLPAGVTVVTTDEIQAGRMQMEYIAQQLGGQGRIAILMGDLASNATRLRTQGVKDIAAAHPGITIVESQTADFLRNKGMNVTSNWLLAGQEFDAIISNNDEMGIGAAMALRQMGQSDVLVAGVDGTPDALAAIKRGMLTVSIFQDARALADDAIIAALEMIRGQTVEPLQIIPYELITRDNIDQFATR